MQLDKKYISLLYEVKFECEKIHSESISDNIWRIRTDLNLQVCSTGLSDIGIFQNIIFRYWYFQILVFSDIGLSDIGIFRYWSFRYWYFQCVGHSLDAEEIFWRPRRAGGKNWSKSYRFICKLKNLRKTKINWNFLIFEKTTA